MSSSLSKVNHVPIGGFDSLTKRYLEDTDLILGKWFLAA